MSAGDCVDSGEMESMKTILRCFLILTCVSTPVGYGFGQEALILNIGEGLSEVDSPMAEIAFTDLRFAKRPLVYLFFDVTLRNKRDKACWFLLSSKIGPGQSLIGARGGVDAVETTEATGEGAVVIGHFLGTGGFRALLLPPNAEVHLRHFPVSFWGELPENVQIEVVIASQLSVEGKTADNWIAKGSTGQHTEVDLSLSTRVKITGTKHTTANKEFEPKIDEIERLKIQVPIPKSRG